MGGDTVKPLATIVIAPFLTEWAPSVTFSTPKDWNSSRLLLIILQKIFKIFHTDGYPEISWNWWSIFRDERTSTQPEQEQEKLLYSWGLNTHAKDHWLYLPFDSKFQNSKLNYPISTECAAHEFSHSFFFLKLNYIPFSRRHAQTNDHPPLHYSVLQIIFFTPQNSLPSSPHRDQHHVVSCYPQQLFPLPI